MNTNDKIYTKDGLSNNRLEKPTTALLSVTEVAETLGCSPRHIYRLSDAGRMPRPVKLGALVRWNREHIIEWISAGCPKMSRERGKK